MVITFDTNLEIGYRDTDVRVEADVYGRTVRLCRVEDAFGSDVRYQLDRDQCEHLSRIAFEDHRNDRALPEETDDDIEDEAVCATEGGAR